MNALGARESSKASPIHPSTSAPRINCPYVDRGAPSETATSTKQVLAASLAMTRPSGHSR